MTSKKKLIIFTFAGLSFGILTYILIGTGQGPSHFALDCFSGALKNFPFHWLEKTIYLSLGALLLYPFVLRPIIVVIYIALPPRFRKFPRKFIPLANIRMLIFASVFSAFGSIFLAAEIYKVMHNNTSFFSYETSLGLFIMLIGLVLIYLQEALTEIRGKLKRRELLDAIVSVGLLITGFIFLGRFLFD